MTELLADLLIDQLNYFPQEVEKMVEEQKLRMEKDREKEQKKEEVSWGNIFTIITGYN